MLRRRVAQGLAVAIGPALLGALAAAPAGAGTVTVSPPGANADSPRVVLDAAGDAFATWTLETSSEAYVIEAAVRPAGGGWQAPVVVSDPSRSSDRPAIAVDPAGDAVIVWQGLGSGSELIGAAVHPAGGGWQAPETISAGGLEASEPAVAISSGGEATAVWQSSNGANRTILASSHPAGRSWSGPVAISSGGNEANPAIAVNAAGGAVSAWVANGNDIAGAARRVGSAWSGPSYVEYTEWQPTAPRVALDMVGDAVALWGSYHGSEAEIRSAVLPAGKGWKSPVALASTGGEALADGLALTEAGEALAAWTVGTDGSEVIQTASMAPHGSWTPAGSLTGPERHIGQAVLATDPAGDSLVDWDSANGGGGNVVRSRARPAGGGWLAPLNLSGPAESAFIGGAALDGSGNAVALFSRGTAGSTRTVEASEFPIRGALIGPPSIPASAVAGVPVSMSVPALDELGPLGTVDWSLGDGSTASGASITHTYAAAGTYAVSVSGSDVFENAIGGAQRITVAPAAPVLGALHETSSRWREGGKLAAVSSARRPPVGTSFSFTLSEAATLSFAFTTKAAGRKARGRCVAQSHRNVHARRCTRAILRGRLQLSGRPGTDHIRFQGLLSKHARLKPGTYTLTLTASASGLKSAARSISFTILG
jgi:hypothetical protein